MYGVHTLGRKKCPSEEVYSRTGGSWIEVGEVELDPEHKREIYYQTRANQTSKQLGMGKNRGGSVA